MDGKFWPSRFFINTSNHIRNTWPILIIIGYQTRIAAGALSLFCIATAIIFHNDFSDQMQFIAFMKNIALAGGFLFLVVNGAKGYCLDKK